MKCSTKISSYVVSMTGIIFLLTGCLKVGSNEGSNAILLNASVLKGVMGYGSVVAYNQAGNPVWEGEANETGDITLDIRDNLSGILRVSVQPNERSFMVCDAVECADPKTDAPMGFGEPIPLSGDIEFELTTRIFVDSSNLNFTLQINGLTELTSQLITFTATDELIDSAESFDTQAQAASRLIMTALGLDINDNLNLLDFSLINVNQNRQFGEKAQNDSVLSLLNAGFASDLNNIRAFSNLLHLLVLDVTDRITQQDFERLQKQVLRQVLNLAQSQQLEGVTPAALAQIQNAANNPFNFEKLNLLFVDMITQSQTVAQPNFAPFVANSLVINGQLNDAAPEAEALILQGFDKHGRWRSVMPIDTQSLQELADQQGRFSQRIWLANTDAHLAYRLLARPATRAVANEEVQHAAFLSEDAKRFQIQEFLVEKL